MKKQINFIMVDFVIEGKNFDIEQLTKEIEVAPSQIRGIDDWPEAIKNNKNLPEELKSRCEWSICQKEEFCRQIEIPINKIIAKLKGKEQKIMKFCADHELRKGLCITIQAEAMNMPEIVLSSDIVSYFGSLKAEISFNIYSL